MKWTPTDSTERTHTHTLQERSQQKGVSLSKHKAAITCSPMLTEEDTSWLRLLEGTGIRQISILQTADKSKSKIHAGAAGSAVSELQSN